jgi:hypothetical protein
MKIDCHNGWFRGLGDLVCFAWIGEALKAQGRPVEFYAIGTHAEVMRMFQMTVTDDSSGALVPIHGYEEAIAAKSKLNYLEWIADQLGVLDAGPFTHRPRVNIHPMQREGGRTASAEVLVFPEGIWIPRIWPKAYWIDLVEMIKNAGIHVKVVCEKVDGAFSFVHCISDKTLPYVSAAIQKARLVIGNDSGPAHLAATLGVKTLAIQGPTTARIYAHLPEVRSLRKVSLGCSGCHCLPAPKDNDLLGWRASCDYGCGELYRTFPREVFDIVLEMFRTEEAKAA